MKTVYRIVFLFVVITILVCGCGRYREYNIKPDDDFSRAVCEAIGRDFYYHGKGKHDLYGACYEYQIKNKDVDAIVNFADAISAAQSEEQGKISVYVFSDISGGVDNVFCLFNFDYSDTDLKNADIIDGWTLYICSPDVTDESIYFNPLTYTGIKGVRRLSISEQMSQEAEEKEIDWYTYWPDLQEIIIRES